MRSKPVVWEQMPKLEALLQQEPSLFEAIDLEDYSYGSGLEGLQEELLTEYGEAGWVSINNETGDGMQTYRFRWSDVEKFGIRNPNVEMDESKDLESLQDLLDRICGIYTLPLSGPPVEQLQRLWDYFIEKLVETSEVRRTLMNSLNPIERELNMEFSDTLMAEQRVTHVMRRLVDDRRRVLTALAEVLQTLALVLEAERQVSLSGDSWTHRERKAIAQLVMNLCQSRLNQLKWVDSSVARLLALSERSKGEF